MLLSILPHTQLDLADDRLTILLCLHVTTPVSPHIHSLDQLCEGRVHIEEELRSHIRSVLLFQHTL